MQIQWPRHSDQRRALPLSAQRLINFYAEQAPKDAKSPVALFNTPGIKEFCPVVGDGPIRGMEVMDGILYVLSGDVLYSVLEDCTHVALGSLVGDEKPSDALLTITGGSSGTISSITVDGVELLASAVNFTTDPKTTAALIPAATRTDIAPVVTYDTVEVFDSFPFDTGSLNITTHPNTVLDDLLVAFFGISINIGTDSVPQLPGAGLGASNYGVTITPEAGSGWTQMWHDKHTIREDVPSPDLGTPQFDLSASAWWKFASPTDVAAGNTYTFTFTEREPSVEGSALDNILWGGLLRVTGTDALQPVANWSVSTTNFDPTSQPTAPNLTTVQDNTRIYTSVQSGMRGTTSEWDGGDDSFGAFATSEGPSGATNGFLQFSWFYDPVIENGVGHTPPGEVGTIAIKNTSSKQMAVIGAIAFNGPQPNEDFDIAVNTVVDGSILITAPGPGFDGLDVVVTTTGDVTVECGAVIVDGSTTEEDEESSDVTGWVLSTATYLDKSYGDMGGGGSSDNFTFNPAFKSDGTRFFIVSAFADFVFEHNLSVAWDISTASYAGVLFNTTPEVGSSGSSRSVSFSSDGTKMYVLTQDGDKVIQYTLNTAWNLSTASYSGKTGSVSEDGAPNCVAFKPDGTKMYMVGWSTDKVYQYSLSSAWDISTLSYDSVSLDVSNEDTNPFSLAFSSDGIKMFMQAHGSGSTPSVYQYDLTAWDLSTAVYSSISFNASAEVSPSGGMTFSADGLYMYLVDQAVDKLHQYQTGSE